MELSSEESIFSFMLRPSEQDVTSLLTLVIQHLTGCALEPYQSISNLLIPVLVSRSFPVKDDDLVHLQHVDFVTVKNHAQSFLERLISDIRLTAIGVGKLLGACIDSPWIISDSLQRFFVFCFNILLTSTNEANQLKLVLANQDKLVLCKAAIIELMVPFQSKSLKSFVKQILSPSNCINLNFGLSFVTTFYICSNESDKVWLRDLLAVNVKNSLETDSEKDFINSILIVRQLSFDFEITSHPFADYKCWLKHYFGSESKTLADTKKKFSSLCRFLSSLVPYDNAHCLRAHLNEPPVAPTQYRQLWSDYFNLARTRLSDLGSDRDPKASSIFGQGLSGTENQSSIDRDIHHSVNEFLKNGHKIPLKVSEASVIRRDYFESKFIPRLMDENLKLSGIDHEDLRKFIAELAAKGKVPQKFLKLKHHQKPFH